MPTQQEDDKLYMQTAMLHADISKGVRLKVGAVIVTPSRILIAGINGLPSPLGNVLEYWDGEALKTKSEVIHAEQACLNKAARQGVSVLGAKMYITHLPCKHCCANMIAAGISEVIWKEPYRETDGLGILASAGVDVRQYKE